MDDSKIGPQEVQEPPVDTTPAPVGSTSPARKKPMTSAERTRRCRAEKVRRAELQEAEYVDRSNGNWRIRENLRLPGEIAAGIDVQTIAEAIQSAQKWATMLGLPMAEVFPRGGTLRQAEEQIYKEFIRQGCPLMCRDNTRHKKYRLPKEHIESRPPFEQAWICLDGSNTPITPLAAIVEPSAQAAVPIETKTPEPEPEPEMMLASWDGIPNPFLNATRSSHGNTCVCQTCLAEDQVSSEDKIRWQELMAARRHNQNEILARMRHETNLPANDWTSRL